jgi:hypothetical protein
MLFSDGLGTVVDVVGGPDGPLLLPQAALSTPKAMRAAPPVAAKYLRLLRITLIDCSYGGVVYSSPHARGTPRRKSCLAAIRRGKRMTITAVRRWAFIGDELP